MRLIKEIFELPFVAVGVAVGVAWIVLSSVFKVVILKK